MLSTCLYLLKAAVECGVACLIMLHSGMMFTVTVRLKDGGSEVEKKKHLFKFHAMLSAAPIPCPPTPFPHLPLLVSHSTAGVLPQAADPQVLCSVMGF